MDKFKNIFGNDTTSQQSEETNIVDDLWKNSTLSWSTRIKGFIACFALGCICSILSSILLWTGTSLIVFAVLYSIGSLLSLGSTFFLMGPCSQIKRMFAATRIIATIIMLLCIGLTLCAALWWDNGGLCLLFIILQFLAMLWYSLSYIPFARDAIKKIVGSTLDV